MTYQVQITIPTFTNLPKDVVTNTLYFDWKPSGTPGSASFDFLRNTLESVFSNMYGTSGGPNMAAWMRPALTRWKIYNLNDPKPRVPKHESVWPITPVTSQSTTLTQPEVAVVLSYHAAYISGVDRASLRGRIFLGGLGDNFITGGATSSWPVINSTNRTQLTNNLSALLNTPFADDWGWVVFSRKLNQSFPVTGGWIDDALDTQRRRGNSTTVRTSWGS